MKNVFKKSVTIILVVLMALMNLPLSALALNDASITISSNPISVDGIDIDEDIEFDYYIEVNGEPYNGEAIGSDSKHYSVDNGILTLPYNVRASISNIEDGSTYSVKRLEYDNLKYALINETEPVTGYISSKEYYKTVNNDERTLIGADEFNTATDNGANLEIVKYFDDKGNVYNDAVEVKGYTVSKNEALSTSYTLDKYSGWAAEEALDTYSFSIHDISCTHSCKITKVFITNVTTWPYSTSLVGSMSGHNDIQKNNGSSATNAPMSLSDSISACIKAIQQDEMRVYYDYSKALEEETSTDEISKKIIFLTNTLTQEHPDTQVENKNGASKSEVFDDITSYAKAIVEVQQDKTVYESVDVDVNKDVCFDAEFTAAPTGSFVVDFIIYSGTLPESFDKAEFEIKDAWGNPLTEGEDYTLEVVNESKKVLTKELGYTVYKFSGIKKGYYTIQQTKGASGYIVDDNEYAFSVERDGTVLGDNFDKSSFNSSYTALTNNTYNLGLTFKVFKNNSFTINFTKVDQNNDVVSGAKFLMIEREALIDLASSLLKAGVQTAGNLDLNEVIKQLQGTDWSNIDISTIIQLILSIVNLDEIQLEEITLPAILSTTSGEDGVVTFSNSSNILNLLGILTDSGITGEQLKELLESSLGSVIPEQYLTYLNALASIAGVINIHSGVPSGDYIMIESEAPVGYEKNPLVYTVNVTATGTAFASVGVISPVLVDIINSRFGIDLKEILVNEEEFEKYKDTIGGAFDTFTQYSTAVIDGVVAFLAGVIGEDNATSERLNEIKQTIIDYNEQYDDLALAIGQTVKDINSLITDELTTDWRYYDTRIFVDANIVITDCQGKTLDIDFVIKDSDNNEIELNGDGSTVSLPFGTFTIEASVTDEYMAIEDSIVDSITVDDESGEYSFILKYHIADDINVETVDPDCENEGTKTTTKKCSVCEEIVFEDIEGIDKLGHTEVIDDAVAPTCEDTGLTEGIHCSVCNKVIKEQTVVKALGHTEVIDEAVAPTCEETGLTEGIHCAICNKVIKEQTVVKALGHTEVIDKAVAPTCEDTGLTEGIHCSVCNKIIKEQTVVKALGHTEVIDESVAPTCEDTGLTEGVHCSVCNKVIKEQETVKTLGHDYDDGIITKPPTCTEKGKKTFTCKNDSTHTYTVDIELETHQYEKTVTPPTCTEDGYTVLICKECGDTLIGERVSALGHTEVIDKAVAPTCEDTGLTEGVHCSVCNKIIKEQTVVKALGHTEVIDDAVAPTCEDTGLTEGVHCSVCNKIIKEQTVVKALGHTEVIDEAVAPTCEDTGLTEGIHCSVCDKVIKEQTMVSALGHTYKTIETAPTCTQDGRKENICSVCNDTVLLETIPALEHSFEWIVEKEPTVTEMGSKYEKCTICGYQKEAVAIDKLAPEIIEGQNSKWITASSTNLTFCSNASLSDFLDVAVDGNIIDNSNYILSEGGTIVELKQAFLSTLSVGEHTLDVISSNGTASTVFEITDEEKTPEEETTEPATEKPTEAPAKETTSKSDNVQKNTSKTSPATGAAATPAILLAAAWSSMIIAVKKRNRNED